MNGVFCIDKPAGHTSFDVIARMRGILKMRTLGHAGTLDPMATGVLPVFAGRATKACDILPNHNKAYLATFRLGVVTDTQDITGTVLEERPVTVGEGEIAAACTAMVGEQLQLPPMYSAVKVGGKRLYDLARAGKEVEREARPIRIHSLKLLSVEGAEVTIQVACSKGSYIRTLCHDIGQKLGCGGTLVSLRRTMAAGYTLDDCITLEELTRLAQEGRVEEVLRPISSIFESLPKLVLSPASARLYQNGVKLDCERIGVTTPGDRAVYREDGLFLGVSRPDEALGELRLVKLFTLAGQD